jgi:hypothetical protein
LKGITHVTLFTKKQAITLSSEWSDISTGIQKIKFAPFFLLNIIFEQTKMNLAKNLGGRVGVKINFYWGRGQI